MKERSRAGRKPKLETAFSRWMVAHGYTEQYIADRIGVSHSTINAKRQGKKVLPIVDKMLRRTFGSECPI